MRPRLSLLAFILVLAQATYAQINTVQDENSIPTFYFTEYADHYGLDEHSSMILIKTIPDKYGWTRYKFQQYYKGYKVIGGKYTLHQKEHLLKKGSGQIFKDIDLTINSRLDDLDIKNILLARYQEEAVTISSEEMVVIPSNYPSLNGSLVLAHAIIVDGEGNIAAPLRDQLYINATTGQIIDSYTLIKHESATAETKYYGTQQIETTLDDDGNYILRDYTRSEGVFTLDGTKRDSGLEFDYEDFTNEDTTWTWDGTWEREVATDLHYCSAQFHDFMDIYLNWQGIDNEGGELIGISNVNGKFYVNAYWNGSYSHFGNGDCARYDPLTTMDVVGHEFAHGVTDYTSNLIYRNQSGALNESFSDIVGKAFEFLYDYDNFNWFIGDRFRIDPDANYFRSMSDPTERNDPKSYAGEYWYTGTGDNGGVHSNSGVWNYWFYLLVEGGDITNESGDQVTVGALPIEEVLDIVFGAQVGYLGENSNYFHAMYSTLEVAEEFFGLESDQYQAVLNAWNAVDMYPGMDNQDLSITTEERDYYFCQGENIEIPIKLWNEGINAQDGNMVSLILESGNGSSFDIDIELPAIFAQGDSLEFIATIPSDLLNDELTFFTLTINNNEPHQLNNEKEIRVYVIEGPNHDLEVSSFEFVSESSCDTDSIERYRFTLINNGCKVISGDEVLSILLTIDGVEEYLSLPVYSDLLPGRTRITTRFFDPSQFDYTAVEKVEVTYFQDEDTSNNSLEGEFLPVNAGEVTSGYRETFESANLPLYSISGSSFATMDSVISFQNNKVFAVAGNAGDGSYINCPDSEDFYQYNYQKKNLHFCVNTAGMEQPEFRFKYYGKTRIVEENIDATEHNMIRVEIENLDTLLLYGYEQEIWHREVIALPVDYSGEITITAFALAGDGDFLSGLDDSDYILLDNITLQEFGVTSVDDLKLSQITIKPNPAQDYIEVDLGLPIVDPNYRILNMQGQIVIAFNRLDQNKVDISNLMNGQYIFQVFEGNQLVGIEKIVVLN